MDYERISLQKESAVPLYRQVAAALREAIAQGTLAPGERIPPIRTLARILGISQVTVTQAYDLLLAEGEVESHVGRGTFVLPRAVATPITAPAVVSTHPHAPAAEDADQWMLTLTSQMQTPRGRIAQRTMDDALRHLPSDIEPIHFARAVPDPTLFAGQRWQRSMQAAARTLAQESTEALQYGSTLGDLSLRVRIAQMLRRHGFTVEPDEVLLTSGTQQSLDLIARTFIAPGDPVFVEEMSYLAALDSLETRQVAWQSLPVDQDGLRVEALPALAGPPAARPRLLYTIPSGQSPTGTTLSADRRRTLAELASRLNLLLVADEAFHELYLDGDEPLPALHSLAAPGRVLSLVTFNKTIFPAVRMGCIVAARPLIELLAQTKSLIDREASVPLARAVERHLAAPEYARELGRFRQAYRQRRDHVLVLLERHLAPLGCHWIRPSAGISLLVMLPDGIEEIAMVEEAARQGVIVLPGFCFAATRDRWLGRSIRLSYGDLPPERLDQGVRRLTTALEIVLQRRSERPPTPGARIVL